ncbi:MAG TPA: cytochrome c [Thermoanaerobaculia bacterium]|jgi:mono/diheme cytochrome c family protein
MKWLGGMLLGFVLLVVAACLVLWLGLFEVAATKPPGKLEEGLARFALNRAVARRASKASNPLPASAETWGEGLAHYRENCAECHGGPGIEASEAGQGLNPPAPDLTLPRVQKRPDGELYWIVANGIRMTGMPAFGPTHKEKEIWEIVAFLRHLDALSAEEEKALERAGGTSHHADEPPAAATPAPKDGARPE